MRAALLRDDSGVLTIEDLRVDAPERNEILVRVAASGICHSDLHYVDGTWPASYPMLLGHEAAGVVEAVGADVVDLAVGDRVITCLSMSVVAANAVCEGRATCAPTRGECRVDPGVSPLA
jgi:S-(hydroxymethyl)glutathione dehydrogenase/alcohol dehydrogenase